MHHCHGITTSNLYVFEGATKRVHLSNAQRRSQRYNTIFNLCMHFMPTHACSHSYWGRTRLVLLPISILMIIIPSRRVGSSRHFFNDSQSYISAHSIPHHCAAARCWCDTLLFFHFFPHNSIRWQSPLLVSFYLFHFELVRLSPLLPMCDNVKFEIYVYKLSLLFNSFVTSTPYVCSFHVWENCCSGVSMNHFLGCTARTEYGTHTQRRTHPPENTAQWNST